MSDKFYTLEEAKKYLRENWKKGAECPCCRQLVKLYARPLTSSMAYGLVLIYVFFEKNPTQQWVHVEDYLKRLSIPSSIRGDIAKLKYWGLLEDKVAIRDDGSKRNGYYRITPKGKIFVRGEMSVPEKMYMYNQKTYGFSDTYVTIKEALGSKFSYAEIMGDFVKKDRPAMPVNQERMFA